VISFISSRKCFPYCVICTFYWRPWEHYCLILLSDHVNLGEWQWQLKVVKTTQQQQHCLAWNSLDSYGHATIFNCMLATACCLVVGLWLGLDLVSGWFVVMHTYLYYFRLSLSLSLQSRIFCIVPLTSQLITYAEWYLVSMIAKKATFLCRGHIVGVKKRHPLNWICIMCCNGDIEMRRPFLFMMLQVGQWRHEIWRSRTTERLAAVDDVTGNGSWNATFHFRATTIDVWSRQLINLTGDKNKFFAHRPTLTFLLCGRVHTYTI